MTNQARSKPATPRTHRSAQGEQGFAMIVAITILFIGMLLAAAAVTIATQTNGSSRADANRKNALEAAEAGLEVATYRLNMLQPASGCTTDSSSATAGPDANNITWCQSNSYSMGNGSTYQYWVSPAISSGMCAGVNLANSTQGVLQRCITAVGTSNGITERSQIRVAAYANNGGLANATVVGYNGINLSGSATITGMAYTNKILQASGSATVGECQVGPSGSYNPSTPTFCTKQDPNAMNPAVVNPIQIGNTATVNDNQRIVNAIAGSGSPTDVATGNVQYTANGRLLNLSGGATLKLGGSVYNFCSVNLSGGSVISTAGQNVTIYVDNNSTGDGCLAGGNNSGYWNLSGGSINNLANRASAFTVNVLGAGSVTLSGGAGSYGTVNAPQSAVNFSGSSTWYGSVYGDTVTMSGGSFTYSSGSSGSSTNLASTYFRTAWVQCTTSYAASAPGANCG